MLTVSNYHYIRENFETPYPSIFGLTPGEFKKQLLSFKRIGKFIHPNDLLINCDEILRSEQNYILVTFDDGLKEQFEFAKPILDKLEISALFFANSINYIEKEVSQVHKIHLLRSQLAPNVLLDTFAEVDTDCVVNLTFLEKEMAKAHYNYDDAESANLKYILNFKLSAIQLSNLINGLFERFFNKNKVVNDLYMSEQQLQVLAKEGVLGSHSHSHIALGLLEPQLIYEELSKTKDYFEKLTKTEIAYISYPYGSKEACAKPVPEFAKEIGYTIGFTMERGINSGKENQLLLRRFDCNDLPSGKNGKNFKNEYSFIYE